MEDARTDGDELIADYVDCLMSLDTNARPGQNDSLILEGAPDVEAAAGISLNGVVQQDVMREFAPADADDPKDPVLGMTFESDEAAKMFYHEYARRLGFPFRVGRSRRSKGVEEVVIMKRFVCSREGVYKKKQPLGEATNKRERASMREGCNAMMEVVREKDHWVVSKLEKAHNHSLGIGSRVGYLRARGLPDATNKVTAMGSDGLGIYVPGVYLRQNILGEGGDGQAKGILQKAYEEILSYERNPGRGLQRDAININEDITIDDTMDERIRINGNNMG
ncbi:hypothetical protein E2562_020332 [Oryza meyeriana var. granulata]|uniref:FAR1 domain-containing protein n=1 Tax=Oryza meyeriana var. granulata TaxID=110450 RepID=A0A6G1EBS0_9ORYZ|nr:hypothetical protein E2562_020332 [Oryza meyeriana var. granulata]